MLWEQLIHKPYLYTTIDTVKMYIAFWYDLYVISTICSMIRKQNKYWCFIIPFTCFTVCLLFFFFSHHFWHMLRATYFCIVYIIHARGYWGLHTPVEPSVGGAGGATFPHAACRNVVAYIRQHNPQFALLRLRRHQLACAACLPKQCKHSNNDKHVKTSKLQKWNDWKMETWQKWCVL